VNHAKALKTLVEEHDVKLHKIPDEIVDALAEATNEIAAELLDDSDPLVADTMASYAEFRNMTAEYAQYSYAANMNARTFNYPES